jgi:hypothetical protein
LTAAARTYARARREYDEPFEHELVQRIMHAIAQAMVTDANAIVLRTAATASALLTVLAATLAISSTAVRSPAALRKTIDELGKRLRRRVAAAQADPDVEEFARRCFYGPEVEGNA